MRTAGPLALHGSRCPRRDGPRLPRPSRSRDGATHHPTRECARLRSAERGPRADAPSRGPRTMTARTATVTRATRETSITLPLTLEGTGKADVKTGVGFLDHLLDSLSRHARFDLTLASKGDLHVDDHHTAEDCALALGQAVDRALGERRGVDRFGWGFAPPGGAPARAGGGLVGRADAGGGPGPARESVRGSPRREAFAT